MRENRKLLSQNFLRSRKLISQLISRASINKSDLVLEIGPGRGIITESLLERSRHVIAVELDRYWYIFLREKFGNIKNLTLCNTDFLKFKLPDCRYKVFANVPFSIEGKIIRKLIDARNSPSDCYLVINSKLANRLSAPYKENMFSIMHKPWFDISICYRFKPDDFYPIPNVGASLFRFLKREKPLIPFQEITDYKEFIQLGFNQGLPVFRNLKKEFGYKITLRAFKKTNLARRVKPGYLILKQWIGLYKELKRYFK